MSQDSPQIIEKELIQEIATILSLAPDKVNPQTPLHDLGMDSLSFVEVLIFIEKRFNLKLIESGLNRESFKTIRSLAECTAQELEKRP